MNSTMNDSYSRVSLFNQTDLIVSGSLSKKNVNGTCQ